MYRNLSSVFLSLGLVATCFAEDPVDFVRDIRPILSENCAFCHGPDAANRAADLRVDTADGIAAVIEASDRHASELFDRLTTDDEDIRMPPVDSNRSLTPEQIELIGLWIDEGAQWDQHWAFRPIERPEEPAAQPDWLPLRKNPIDAFVQQQLVSRAMAPSHEANKRTLIRRLSLDLTGLPPTPEQVDAFLADNQPLAYERLVDRLLKSPAYGQRMAWDWLDAARYADTNGYQGDNERTMWPWRDWVVQSFNDNLPYDKFTVWQLAGDLLPDATNQQKMATGFCRNHMINGEGGRIAEENRVEYVMDMTETMGTVWLGMTLNCCRCHDHKYDPITNQEYYELFSFFNQTPVTGAGGNPQTAPFIDAPSTEQTNRLAELDEKIAKLDGQMKMIADEFAKTQRDWEIAELDKVTADLAWKPLKPQTAFAKNANLKILDDNSVLAAGWSPPNDTYTYVAQSNLDQVSALRIEALRHKTMTKNGLARSDSGNFVLTSLKIEVKRKDADESEPIKIARGKATYEQNGFKIENVFDDDPKSGWAVHEGRTVDREHTAVFAFDKPLTGMQDAEVTLTLSHDSRFAQHNLGRFRISLTEREDVEMAAPNEKLIVALRTTPDERNNEQKKLLADAHRRTSSDYVKLLNDRDSSVKERENIDKQIPKVMTMEDMAKPRKTFILSRGLYNKPTETEVFSRFPDFLPAPNDADDANRLTLARWLVADDNPLTARVTVNRFWQQIFGIGLVKTTEDFGAQGEIPVHMDLLNWLSAEFRESGWDVKHLVRLIVTSHTYRQSSKIASPAVFESDPQNRYLARGARYRMPSWMIRDQALAASGLLSAANSGPAVNTYQPPGVWEEASFGKKKYKLDGGEKLYRRSLYTFWRRIIAPTMFFDSASRQACTVKVSRTNTPLHALQTLNNVAYVEAARALAQLTLQQELDSDRERVNFVLQRMIARPASDNEFEVLKAGLERTRTEFNSDAEEATALLSMGESERDASLDAVDHASWTALCLAVLNFDETLTRE